MDKASRSQEVPCCFVTVVIVNWNRKDCVINLLDSLQACAYPGMTIVTVDNASTDGSVEAIRQHPLPFILIENSENLGGTGGFNAGIRYALNHLEQKYIWLLDNDAEVRPDTLKKLIAAMEIDTSIGIAGSCILNPDNRTQIVEAGGYVDVRTATWKPNLRYQPYSIYKDSPPIDVDYVPACSALVCRQLFKVVGILDERYFLHWDDVDFGRVAREKGFRVVAVLDSIVFHGTEKGYSNAVLYYDVRNSLLYISKHLSAVQRVLPVFLVCLRSLMAARLFGVMGEKLLSWYLYQALESFNSDRFGPSPLPPSQLQACLESDVLSLNVLSSCRNVVVFAIGSSAEIFSAIRSIHSAAPDASITLAAPSDRLDAYRMCENINHFIVYDFARDGIRGCVAVGLKLLLSRFDCAISAGTGFVVPFAFFVRRHVVMKEEDGRIYKSNACLGSFWKLPFVVLVGFVLSISNTIKCWLASRSISS